jgi:hypothetical protein
MKNINTIKVIILSSLIALSSAALAAVQNSNMVNQPGAPTSITPLANPGSTSGTSVGVNPTNNGQSGSNSCAAGSPHCLCPAGSTTNCQISTAVTPVTMP